MSEPVDAEALWAVGELEDDGGTIIVAWRQDVPPSTRASLGAQFVIEWSFSHDCPGGLPTRQQLEPALKFQELVTPELEAGGRAILAMACTGNGVREMYFYCIDPQELQSRLNSCVAGQNLPLALNAGHDPEWAVFDQHVGLFQNAKT